MSSDYYKLLGVDRDAPLAVIDAAYKALLRRHHPDHASDERDRQERERVSRQLGEAHAVLADSRSRSRHDDELAQAEAGVGQQGDSERASDAREPAAQRRGQEQDRIRENGAAAPAPDARDVYEGVDFTGLDWDDITAAGKLDLLQVSVRDKTTRKFVRRLRRRRQRVGWVPAAWLGLRGKPAHTRTARPTRASIALGGFVGAACPPALLWWYGLSVGRDLLQRSSLNFLHIAPPVLHAPLLAYATGAAAGALTGMALALRWLPQLQRYPAGTGRGAGLCAAALLVAAALPYLAVLSVLVGAGAVLAYAVRELVRLLW